MTAAHAEKETSLTARASWLLAAKTVAFVLTTALPFLLVRRLNQTEFGLYKQVFLIVGTVTTVMPLGFGMSAFYFLPRERDRQRSIVINILVVNALLGAVAFAVLFAFPNLLGALFNGQELTGYSAQIGLLIFLWLVASILEIVPVAHQELRAAAVFIVASQLSKTVLLVGVALIHPSVLALIYAATIHCAVQTTVLLAYLRSRFPSYLRSFDWSYLRRQVAYAAPFGLLTTLYPLQMDVHNYFVSYQFGPAMFAIYSIGCFQLPFVNIISESIGGVLIPRISVLEKEGNHREVIVVTARVMRKLAAIYFPVYALLMVVGPEFITLFFTERFRASWPIFAINLTTLPLSVLVLDGIQRAYVEVRYFILAVRVAATAVLVVALYFVTGRYGLVETIAVVVAVNILQKAVASAKLASVLGVRSGDLALLRDVGKLAVASAAAAAAAALLRHLVVAHPAVVVAACGLAFCAVYGAVVLALGVPSSEERAFIRAQIARVQRVLLMKWAWAQ